VTVNGSFIVWRFGAWGLDVERVRCLSPGSPCRKREVGSDESFLTLASGEAPPVWSRRTVGSGSAQSTFSSSKVFSIWKPTFRYRLTAGGESTYASMRIVSRPSPRR